MPTVQFFIAMYRTGVYHRYHWALIVTGGGFPSSRKRIKTFEIVQVRDERPDGSVDAFWKTPKREVVLAHSSNFIGIVAFPPFTDDRTLLRATEEWLDEMPAFPEDQGNHNMDRSGWHCARWVLWIFVEYGSAWGLDFVESMHRSDTLYNEIRKQAMKLESQEETERIGDWAYGRAPDGSRVKYASFPPEYIKSSVD